MHTLCTLNNVRSFKVRATYLSSEFNEEDLQSFRKDIISLGLEQEMQGYLTTLETYPAEQFMDDKVHLRDALPARTVLLQKLGL